MDVTSSGLKNFYRNTQKLPLSREQWAVKFMKKWRQKIFLLVEIVILKEVKNTNTELCPC